ncbi:MAG: exodeoxyribonuclease VII large subunit [Pseudomonadota bacterium]
MPVACLYHAQTAMTQDLTSGATPPDNTPEFSVTEISVALKRTVEERFDHVRVRGEVSRPSRPRSGHLYFTLKDERSVLDAVCWRGTVNRLSVQPEEGMEVVVTGRLTTYAGSSKYQVVVEQLDLAGEGALLKLLEERRKRLAAEGLFAEEAKRLLPYLPCVIGVVTSPTGAVIRDILHRLADRFPRHVLLWPVSVQGEKAAEQVAGAINGFNALSPDGQVPRPDLLIVARGGGSLEDLMAFNEEIVVRSAAASTIPLISAVGHETDTTLIDFAADRRAPTPTAAAEMAVPVRADLLADLAERERRRQASVARILRDRRTQLDALARAIARPKQVLETPVQRLDHLSVRLDRSAIDRLGRLRARLAEQAAKLVHPRQRLAERARLLRLMADRLDPAIVTRRIAEGGRRLAERAERIDNGMARQMGRIGDRFERASSLLESCSYRRVLDRGFAVVRGEDGTAITRAAALKPNRAIRLELADGNRGAVITGAPRAARRASPSDDAQGDLLSPKD